MPTLAADDDGLGLRNFLEFFVECTGARSAKLVIRSQRWDHERVVAVGDPTNDSVSTQMAVGEDAEAVLTLAGDTMPDQRLLDLFASNLGRELHRLRVHAEATLLNRAANSADAAILIFGPSGSILFANHRADTLISKQTEDELTINWNSEPQPLFRLLCAKVGEAFSKAEIDPWCDWLEISDGSELTVELMVLSTDEDGLGPAVMAVLREVAGPQGQRLDDFAGLHQLSPREHDVLRLLVQGFNTRGLADRLGISPHTVRDHLKNVFRKTSTRSRSELLSALAGAGNHPR